MKPSEMSNEELAWRLDELSYLLKNSGWHQESSLALEAAARLRNSIPKPVVEVRVYENDSSKAQVNINGHNIYGGMWVDNAHESKKWLRTALGINYTEGGSDESL